MGVETYIENVLEGWNFFYLFCLLVTERAFLAPKSSLYSYWPRSRNTKYEKEHQNQERQTQAFEQNMRQCAEDNLLS